MSLCHQAFVNPLQAILTQNQVSFLIFLHFSWKSVVNLLWSKVLWYFRSKTLSVRTEVMMVLILELFSCSLCCSTSPLLEVIKIKSKLLNALGVMVEYCSMTLSCKPHNKTFGKVSYIYFRKMFFFIGNQNKHKAWSWLCSAMTC